MKANIIHICPLDKFIPPFIDFVEANFNFKIHHFFLLGDLAEKSIKPSLNVTALTSRVRIFSLLLKMYSAQKIILHSVFSKKLICLLALQPWLLKKCYWVMWGGDLYYYQFRDRNCKTNIYELIRAFVIKRLGHIITYIDGDYELARKWYGARARHHKCFTYPSNLYKTYDVKPKSIATVAIQIGNSATATNRHLKVLKRLREYKDADIKVYVPLSYGDSSYARRVIEYGASIFGNRLIPLVDFMPPEKYLEFLAEIDIAIFDHNRQQAIGNTITLLGLGKKVYISKEVTPWGEFKRLGLHIFDLEHLEITQLSPNQAEENKKIIAAHFSEANLVAQLGAIFGVAKLAVSK